MLLWLHIFTKIAGWKSKTKTDKARHNKSCWCCFSSVSKGYHFVLLIWRYLGTEYEVNFILRTARGFAT